MYFQMYLTYTYNKQKLPGPTSLAVFLKFTSNVGHDNATALSFHTATPMAQCNTFFNYKIETVQIFKIPIDY